MRNPAARCFVSPPVVGRSVAASQRFAGNARNSPSTGRIVACRRRAVELLRPRRTDALAGARSALRLSLRRHQQRLRARNWRCPVSSRPRRANRKKRRIACGPDLGRYSTAFDRPLHQHRGLASAAGGRVDCSPSGKSTRPREQRRRRPSMRDAKQLAMLWSWPRSAAGVSR